MTSLFRTLNSLVIAALLFSNAAHATFNSDSREALKRAITNIKSNSTISGKMFRAGNTGAAAGVVAMGVPAALVSIKILPSFAGKWTLWLGKKIFLAGLMIDGVGIAIAVFEPVPAHGTYLTDYFLTPAGFKEFLQGTPDLMEEYAEMDPRLADLVLQMSYAVDAAK